MIQGLCRNETWSKKPEDSKKGWQVDLKWTIRKKWMEMAKKKPRGHNIGGSSKQKRRKEKKGKSQMDRDHNSKSVSSSAEKK